MWIPDTRPGSVAYRLEFVDQEPTMVFTVEDQPLSTVRATRTLHAVSTFAGAIDAVSLTWDIEASDGEPAFAVSLRLETAHRDPADPQRFTLIDALSGGDDAFAQWLGTPLDGGTMPVLHPAESSSTPRFATSCNPDAFRERWRYEIRTTRGDFEFMAAMDQLVPQGVPWGGPLPISRAIAVAGDFDGQSFQIDQADDLFFANRIEQTGDPTIPIYSAQLLALRFREPIGDVCGLYFAPPSPTGGGGTSGENGGYIAFELSCADLAPVNPFDVTFFHAGYVGP
jgi:hypothetical protein